MQAVYFQTTEAGLRHVLDDIGYLFHAGMSIGRVYGQFDQSSITPDSVRAVLLRDGALLGEIHVG